MIFKHFALFNSDTDIINWDKLRNSEDELPYFIPFNKQEYLDILNEAPVSNILEDILSFCKSKQINKVVSIGSGKCILEYQLMKASDLEVVVSDNSISIDRISSFNIFHNAVMLDILNDDINFIDEHTLVLLSRIDTEFDQDSFISLFSKLNNFGTKYICLIPAELLSMRIALAEVKTYITSILKMKKKVFCGYIRTKSEFTTAWENYFIELPKFSNKTIFQLIKK